jgi:7-cyano-7-deazaguanine synthase in queuosine biosynthesis
MSQQGGERIMTVKLLWTGGFDSTYRLLELVLQLHEKVQPYYFIDLKRKSYHLELERMATIQRLVALRQTKGCLLPLSISLVSELQIDEDIAHAWQELRERIKLGRQYVWLRQHARNAGWAEAEVELGIEGPIETCHIQNAIFVDPRAAQPVLLPGAATTIFRPFSLPVRDLTKREMQARAERYGFANILAETWFCHTPYRGMPCGHCKPCSYARHERDGVVFAPSHVRFAKRAIVRLRRLAAAVGSSPAPRETSR